MSKIHKIGAILKKLGWNVFIICLDNQVELFNAWDKNDYAYFSDVIRMENPWRYFKTQYHTNL